MSSQSVLIERAPAKVNLSLNILGRRADGYHLLDSLVVFCELADELTLRPGTSFGLEISGPYQNQLDASPQNLVWRAARMISEASECPMAEVVIELNKVLPVASGIGGGSSDAAAALRSLIKFGELKIDADKLQQIALALGADVPMCLSHRSAYVSGIGEKIEFVDVPPLDLVLVNCGRHVSTTDVFQHMQLSDRTAPLRPATFPTVQTLMTYLQECGNDLEEAASNMVPEIGHTLGTLAVQDQVELTRMSGSGATCFGIFPDAHSAEKAVSNIQKKFPDWWVKYTRILTNTALPEKVT